MVIVLWWVVLDRVTDVAPGLKNVSKVAGEIFRPAVVKPVDPVLENHSNVPH